VFAGLGGTAPGSALDGPRAGGPTAPDVGALQQTFLAGFPGSARGLSRGRRDGFRRGRRSATVPDRPRPL